MSSAGRRRPDPLSGVTFERYEDFEHDERGVVRAEGGPPIAWFTDPSGNVLAVPET